MLHYKILSYGSDYDWEYMVGLISLRDRSEIEKQFVRRLSDMSSEEPFFDDVSAALMKEVDQAERTGEYAVNTPEGKGCITCLSDGVRFGLMVIDTAKHGEAVITNPDAVDYAVLEWLARAGDYTLVLTDNECGSSLKEVLALVNNGDADLEYQGQTYSAYSIRDCINVLLPLIEKNESDGVKQPC